MFVSSAKLKFLREFCMSMQAKKQVKNAVKNKSYGTSVKIFPIDEF